MSFIKGYLGAKPAKYFKYPPNYPRRAVVTPMSQKLGKQRSSLTCPRCSWEDMNTGRESKYMLFPSPHLNQNKQWASARSAPLWSLRTVRLGHPCLENSCKYVFLSETPTQRPPAR